jgi:hypothetical protein
MLYSEFRHKAETAAFAHFSSTETAIFANFGNKPKQPYYKPRLTRTAVFANFGSTETAVLRIPTHQNSHFREFRQQAETAVFPLTAQCQ